MLCVVVALQLVTARAHETMACDGAEGAQCEAGDVLLQATSDRNSVLSQATEQITNEKFLILDEDRDGRITLGEIRKLLVETDLDTVLDRAFDEADANHDSVVDEEEFVEFVEGRLNSSSARSLLAHKIDAAMNAKKHAAMMQVSSLQNTSKGGCSSHSDCEPWGYCYDACKPHCLDNLGGGGCQPKKNDDEYCWADVECRDTLDGCDNAMCGCFPNKATAIREDGSTVFLVDLRLGDRIVATDEYGGRVIDEVAFSSLADENAKRRAYLQVATSEGLVLDITGDHHVPVGAKCCTDLKVAQDLLVGDTIWTFDSSGDRAKPQMVSSIQSIVADGLHSPILVGGGFPVVSNFVTSFGSLQDVRSAAKVYPVVQRVSVSFGVSEGAARLDNLFECAKAKLKTLWAGNGHSSAADCADKVFIRSRQIEVTV